MPRAEVLFVKSPVGGATARSQVLALSCLRSRTQLMVRVFLSKTLKNTRSGQKKAGGELVESAPGTASESRAVRRWFVRAEEEFLPRAPYLESTGAGEDTAKGQRARGRGQAGAGGVGSGTCSRRGGREGRGSYL